MGATPPPSPSLRSARAFGAPTRHPPGATPLALCAHPLTRPRKRGRTEPRPTITVERAHGLGGSVRPQAGTPTWPASRPPSGHQDPDKSRPTSLWLASRSAGRVCAPCATHDCYLPRPQIPALKGEGCGGRLVIDPLRPATSPPRADRSVVQPRRPPGGFKALAAPMRCALKATALVAVHRLDFHLSIPCPPAFAGGCDR